MKKVVIIKKIAEKMPRYLKKQDRKETTLKAYKAKDNCKC